MPGLTPFLFVLVAVLISASAVLSEQGARTDNDPASGHDPEARGLCVLADGAVPRVVPISGGRLLREHGAIVAATMLAEEPGDSIILLDERVLSNAPEKVWRFVIDHECQHIRLGHKEVADDPRIDARGLVALEFEADCAAARTLIASGRMQYSDIAEVSTHLEAVSRMYGMPPEIAAERRAHLRRCLAADEGAARGSADGAEDPA